MLPCPALSSALLSAPTHLRTPSVHPTHATHLQKQDTQDIVDAVTALLNGDKSKDVRMAVVLSLPLDTHTLPVLLQRIRDIAPTVRPKPKHEWAG